jgi:hypothetical protein
MFNWTKSWWIPHLVAFGFFWLVTNLRFALIVVLSIAVVDSLSRRRIE